MFIDKAIEDLQETLASKNKDYRIDGEFSNFEYAAEQVSAQTPYLLDSGDVILTQMFIKLGRLQGLPADPNNEARLDTYKDLAGYAILLYAYALSQEEE